MPNAITTDKEQEFIAARALFIRAEGDCRLAAKLAAKQDVRITARRIELLAERFDWFSLLDNVRSIVAENFATEAAMRREKNQLFLSKAKLKLMHAILGEVETDSDGRILRVVKRAVEARSLEGCVRALADVFREERSLFGEVEPTTKGARRSDGMNFFQFIMNEAEKARRIPKGDEVRIETKLDIVPEEDVKNESTDRSDT